MEVHLGGERFGMIAPEQVPAFLALARGLALTCHQDEAGGRLYIASPLTGRRVALTGEAEPEVLAALCRHLAAVGATVAEGAGRGDVCLEMRPAPRPHPAAWFSLRQPLASWTLARHLAATTSGAARFCAWLDARGWCPTVRLVWDAAYPADELAVRVVAALHRFFAAPLPKLYVAAFAALLALPLPASQSVAEPEGPEVSPPVPREASPPAPREAGPLVLAPLRREASVPPPPPPLPPSFEPPGAGVVRVFSARLDAALSPAASARVFDREQRPTAPVAPSSPRSTARAFRRYPAVTAVTTQPVRREPAPREARQAVMRLHEYTARPAVPLEPLHELRESHVFRITPGARVPG